MRVVWTIAVPFLVVYVDLQTLSFQGNRQGLYSVSNKNKDLPNEELF